MESSVRKTNDIRLQVFLSHSGVCSRRKALDIILQGQVTVNGAKTIEPSTPIDPRKDKVFVNGREIKTPTCQYILLNKPRGCVTTRTDRFAPQTVLEFLPREFQHLFPVGRLDKDTEGLLLLTNDGDLAYRLTHPKFNVDKTYQVKVRGFLTADQRKSLEEGIVIDGQKTAPARIDKMRPQKEQTEFLLTIHEGRKRQIRLMMDKVGHRVIELKRIAQGPLKLGTLSTGQWRFLSPQEVEQAKQYCARP
ncbi:MAG: pseudouridine synthase [Candidatus Omnitrophota bacterium]